MIEILKRFFNYLRVRHAVYTAKRLHAQTGKRYYVLSIGGKLHCLTRFQINYLVSKRVLYPCMRQEYYLRKYSLTIIG